MLSASLYAGITNDKVGSGMTQKYDRNRCPLCETASTNRRNQRLSDRDAHLFLIGNEEATMVLTCSDERHK
jgi:hypothetical protein